MKAIIETGGKQYVVQEGMELYIEKLDAKADDTVSFNHVLMVDDKIGHPYVKDASVIGTVVKNGKNKKVKIYKYKAKSRSNRLTQGHRQPYTKVIIKTINVK